MPHAIAGLGMPARVLHCGAAHKCHTCYVCHATCHAVLHGACMHTAMPCKPTVTDMHDRHARMHAMHHAMAHPPLEIVYVLLQSHIPKPKRGLPAHKPHT